MGYRLIYTTFPDLATAEKTAETLLEARLVACANILPAMVSLYRWAGKTERAEEVVMLLKTTAAHSESVVRAVEEAHPYEVPAILVLPLEGGSAAFLGWIEAETHLA